MCRQLLRAFAKTLFRGGDVISRWHFRTMTSVVEDTKKDQINQDYYVWIDLEMTGLDEKIHKIVEIACIVTDVQLKKLDDGVNFVLHQPQEVLNNSTEWCKIQHGKSGLMEKSLNSKITVEEADLLVSNYIKKLTNYDQNLGKYYLAGNTVHMDKRFLEKYMTKINSILHYRIIDVSTIKTLCCNWYPDLFNTLPEKCTDHRALGDIINSINELATYKNIFFKSQ